MTISRLPNIFAVYKLSGLNVVNFDVVCWSEKRLQSSKMGCKRHLWCKHDLRWEALRTCSLEADRATAGPQHHADNPAECHLRLLPPAAVSASCHYICACYYLDVQKGEKNTGKIKFFIGSCLNFWSWFWLWRRAVTKY